VGLLKCQNPIGGRTDVNGPCLFERCCRPSEKLSRKSAAIVAALILCATILTSAGYAQTARKPLSKSEIIELLQNEVPPGRVEELARKYGISFEVSPEAEKQLREAGATEALLNALRELAPRPSPPTPALAVLSIKATPGGAQVYVDDEAAGTTSAEGRLRISRLAVGEHRLRLSREGYQDFEQKVTLAAGEAVRIIAKLEAVKPAVSRGYLGVSIMNLTPALARQFKVPDVAGVLVNQVKRRSPAKKAGLKQGDIIRIHNGQTVDNSDRFRSLVASTNPGTEVTLEIVRDGKPLTLKVTLGER
jgi:hypothetical protein